MVIKRFGILTAGIVLLANGLLVNASAATPAPKMNGRVAFSSAQGVEQGDIYTANPDGSGITNLTHSGLNQTLIATPSYSPDGKKIAYSKFTGGEDMNIFVMNADGSNDHQLTDLGGTFQYPNWSPDGSKIAFSGYVPDHTSDPQTAPELMMMNADGSNITNITSSNSGQRSDYYPTYSPDGTKIAFVRYADNDTGIAELYTYNVSTTAITKLTSFNSGSLWGVSWSPDGSKLATSLDDGSSLGIFTMNADGSNVQAFNFCPGQYKANSYPQWSPDGKKLMFATNCYHMARDIVITDIDGSNPVNLGDPQADEWDTPSWQPVAVSSSSTTNGVTTNMVSGDQSDSDFWVDKDTVLVVDGTAGDVNVASGGVLKGHGTITGSIDVASGGTLAPGNSPGCIASNGLSFVAGSTYEVEIAGATVCSQYDQSNITGSVNLGGATLSTQLLNGFVGDKGNTFTIVNNDSTDAVTGIFNGLAEGSTFTVGGTIFKISYVGGDGNDVVLTIQNSPVPSVPNTGLRLIRSNPLVSAGVTLISSATLLFLARRRLANN